MKYVKPAATIAAAIAMGTSSAMAGGFAEPQVEQEVVMAPETVVAGTSGSGSFVIPLILLAIIAAVASNSGGSGGGGGTPVPPLEE